MPNPPFPRPRRLSCGIVFLAEPRQILLCHVTGQRHWDLPKGGIHADETPLDAALRETREETGLRPSAADLLDLGRHAYTARKDLHLFATLGARFDSRELRCESCFVCRSTGRSLPEMDGFGWFDFERVGSLCSANMAALLGSGSGSGIDLDAVVRELRGREREPLAA